MKKWDWQIRLGIVLVIFSVLFYFFHYLIFRDAHHIFIYLIGDIAFVFFEVLLVTLIIHRVLSEREKRNRLEKLNMVIGVFFSEVGTELLTYLSDSDPKLNEIRTELVVTTSWTDKEFKELSKSLKSHTYDINIQKVNLEDLCVFLKNKRDLLLRLMENPNLLEHEKFTELLRAVFHVTEELHERADFKELPDTDIMHLSGDIKRAYVHLVHQWLDYMRHLKANYPYLFSLAMRMNPFDKEASPIVR